MIIVLPAAVYCDVVYDLCLTSDSLDFSSTVTQ